MVYNNLATARATIFIIWLFYVALGQAMFVGIAEFYSPPPPGQWLQIISESLFMSYWVHK